MSARPPDPRPPLRRLMAALAGCALAAVAAADTPPPAEGPPTAGFVDVAATAGVARPHHKRSFDNPYAHVMEGYTALGAAAAVADYDGDGDDDLFVTDSALGRPNHLYRNDGGLRFTDVAAEAGVAVGNDAANATTDALWFDHDGDGRPDLLVVRFGQSLLFRNRGDGTFADVTAEVGLARRANSMVALAFDHDRDGDLDLLFGDYFAPVDLFDPATPRFFPESVETAANGGGITLYRNDGGRFVEVTAAAGLAGHTGWTLDLGHADFDHDGDDDLYVAADFGTDRFFVNDGDGTFTDATREAIGIDTKKGMNAEWGDFDGDGRFDVYVTNITDETMREGNFLWRNEGDGTFVDVARETGTHDTGWGWGGKFLDYDNDGWLDLYVVNGWVSAGSESYLLDVLELMVRPDVDLADARNWPPMGDKSLSGYQRNVLFHNRGGTLFEDVAASLGVDSLSDGRGVAVADFDDDGRLDLFVANAGAVPHLWHNVTTDGHHWVQFLLTGELANRDAVGTRVRLTAGGRDRWGFVDGGNGFAGQSTRRVHFGLGTADRIERVEVLWPSGRRQVLTDLPVDRRILLVEGRAADGGGDGGTAPAPAPGPVDERR